MMNLDDKFDLADTLPENITYDIVTVNPKVVIDENNDALETDFKEARDRLHTVMHLGTKAVTDLEKLSSMSQSAEHYAALSQMIKNVTDASKVLMSVHTERSKVRRPAKTENHLHVTTASTMEIAEMLRNQEKIEHNDIG